MHSRITSRIAVRKAEGDGCSSPVRTIASWVAIRRAAAKQDVARSARNIGDPQGEQGVFGIAFFEFLRDQVVERVLDERLDQIVVGVVALVAGGANAPLHGDDMLSQGIYDEGPV